MLRLLQLYFATFARFAPRFSGRLVARLFLTPQHYPVQSDAGRELLATAERQRAGDEAAAVVYRWRNRGPRVLVLHGWSDRAANLGDVIRRLLDAGYDVTAADMPAHGDARGKRTNMREWQLVLRGLSPESGWHAVVAHSLGAFVASVLTRGDLPQYGTPAIVDRLVLLAPPNASMDMLDIFCDALRVPPSVRVHAVRVLSDIIHADFASFSTGAALAGYAGEALIIHDREDRRVPFSHFEAIRRNAPRHRYVETQGLGHRRLLGDDETLDFVAGFLRKGSLNTPAGRVA